MRKVYYIYNPRTQTYDRIYPTVRQRALSILRRLFFGMGLGAGSFIVLLLIFGSQVRDAEFHDAVRERIEQLNREKQNELKLVENKAENGRGYGSIAGCAATRR